LGALRIPHIHRSNLPITIKTATSFSLFALATFLPLSDATAGGTGYSTRSSCGNCVTIKFQTLRDNQLVRYRHYEDRRRYNSAPCCGEVKHTPYVVKTVVVSRKRTSRVTYDSNGRRCCRKVTQVVYKDIYSNGRCHVWTKTS
jgi:hypothetical protein